MNACVGVIQKYLGNCRWGQNQMASVFAPANIALCKYWGKRDPILNLPVTDSLSISLGALGSHCTISLAEEDHYVLNGSSVDMDSVFATRLRTFLDWFRGPADYRYRLESVNTVATAAGFASSASGFAAVVKALQAVHGWQLDPYVLSILARMGSGSACRSLWNGFVHWHAGRLADGTDSFAEVILSDWKTLRVGLLSVDAGEKAVSSREAMNRTVATSILYRSWTQQVEQDVLALHEAIGDQDFHALGSCAEQNALAMHATMLAARPAVLYWKPATVGVLHAVWQARSDGLPAYFTMDAGPNVKLLFEQSHADDVKSQFPQIVIANPWETP